MKVKIRDRARWEADRLHKVALATTPRVQLDLYCVAPGQSQRPHTHAEQDKLYIVLEGQGRFRVGDDEESLAAGDLVVAPAGREHGLVNDGAGGLLVLVVVAPPPIHQAGGERAR